MQPELLQPDWAAPAAVRALMSTRRGGSGRAPFDSFNLGADAADPALADNRRRFAQALGAEPIWLQQVHGAGVLVLDGSDHQTLPPADASVTDRSGVACAVLVADCLPVLFCTDDGRAVGAAHAGWRGLAAGVLEHTVQALCRLHNQHPDAVLAWLGPCIGPLQFEVGADVLRAFGQDPEDSDLPYFVRRDRADGQRRWLADLPALARQRLQRAGVRRIAGGPWCTVSDRSAFFSFRRDGASGPTGRMAAGIAIARR
jgi:YfiH family protein